MRLLTTNVPSIEDIGYFEGDRLKCTAWGPTATIIEKPKFDGLGVSLQIISVRQIFS